MEKVNLFITCLLDTLFPDTAQAVVDVLEHLRVTVHIPKGQTCCGQPAFNAGFWDEARDIARYNIDLFSKAEGPIIIPSGSCGVMITRHYPELFANDPVYGPKARTLAGRLFRVYPIFSGSFACFHPGSRIPGQDCLPPLLPHPAWDAGRPPASRPPIQGKRVGGPFRKY
jgi:hypothetical protein